MCTVSIIPFVSSSRAVPVTTATNLAAHVGYRLVTNRDEQCDRAAAAPPAWRALIAGQPPTKALFPVDPDGGGTWVAATPAGVSLCLLNANPRPYPPLPPRRDLLSRGVIIPTLLAEGVMSAGHVAELFQSGLLDLARFAPFSVLAAGIDKQSDRLTVLRIHWNRSALGVRRLEQDDSDVTGCAVLPSGAVCGVSSGLGDDIVRPRVALFRQRMPTSDLELSRVREVQDSFHAHTWPDRPEISVLMSRSDARTVSITTVEVRSASPDEDAVTMSYRPVTQFAEARHHLGVRRVLVAPASARIAASPRSPTCG